MLPVIDISGLTSPALSERKAVGRHIRTACLDKGFFYIAGHGVDPDMIEALLVESRAFFDLPDASKQAVSKANSPANRGYEMIGGQTLQPGARPDLKEGFYMGLDLAADDPRVLAGKFNHGANQWPEEAPAFRAAAEAYHAALTTLAVRLMGGLALSLNLPEDHFAGFCHDPLAVLRLLHYPPQPRKAQADEIGAGAHTDFGALTILLQDGQGGLEVWDHANDRWLDAYPVPGTFIVNLGDMIARWTNDMYRSTRHRVINRSGRERYSAPFFFSGAPDHNVVCLPTCLAVGAAPLYAPTTAEAHLRAMYERTYG